MKKTIFFVLFFLAAIFVLNVIKNPSTRLKINNLFSNINNSSQSSTENNTISKFENEKDLKTFLEENQSTFYGGYGMGGAKETMLNSVLDTAPGVGSSQKLSVPEAGEAGQQDYSKTNVQVEGVDEGDIVKNDGKYIYFVSGNNLFIIDATPAEASNVLSRIEFKSPPQEIYINGNYLAIYGNNNQVYDMSWFKNFKRQSPYTFFKVFDISDKKNPRQLRDLNFEGSIFASRMIGEYVYLITNYYQYGVVDPIPYPRILDNRGELLNKKSPDVYYFSLPYDSFNFLSVSSINIKNNNQDIKASAYLLPSAQNVYVSKNNIYLTYTRYVSEQELSADTMREILFPKLSSKEKEKITAIENAPSYVLSKSEKAEKVMRLLQMYISFLSEEEQKTLQKQIEESLKQKYKDLSKELEKTVIHKIAINNGNLEYKNFGEVAGSVLNQFSMDESDKGDFRIATTKNQTWSFLGAGVNNTNKSYNNLYILNSAMQTVGKLEDLAFDERIYSVRFMGSRAYMVTFKQTDPLFAIDVSNSNNPRVLGKLKVPGFSQYLHPYDENTLIGFGKETSQTESGGVVTEGLKLSLFDVSDVNNLKEIDKVTLGERGANSVALYDHKAFLFSKDKNLLVIPVEIQDEATNQNQPMEKCLNSSMPCILPPVPPVKFNNFRGAYVFDVTKSGFKLKGKIDHADGTNDNPYDWWGYGGYDTTVKRSLWIGDVLYTLSDKYMKANKISDLTELKNLQLVKEEKSDFKIIN